VHAAAVGATTGDGVSAVVGGGNSAGTGGFLLARLPESKLASKDGLGRVSGVVWR
jgi:hypothetical protein